MKKKKTCFLAIVLTMMIMLFAAGCGNSAPTAATHEPTSPAESDTQMLSDETTSPVALEPEAIPPSLGEETTPVAEPWSLEALQNSSWDDIQGWTANHTAEDLYLKNLVEMLSFVAESNNPDCLNAPVDNTIQFPKEQIPDANQFIEKYRLIIDIFNKTSLTQVEITDTSNDDSNIYIHVLQK